tara:strand:+ start:4808 stop:5347 length:540 start_codon:yes stop_codon:yes gene_type:complete
MSTLKVNSIIPVAGVPTGGGGGIVQVVQSVKNDIATGTVTRTTEWTGHNLTVSITPTATSSKIYISGFVSIGFDTSESIWYKLMKGGSAISGATGDQVGSNRTRSTTGTYMKGDNWAIQAIPINYLDTAGSTSALTYTVGFGQFSDSNKTLYINSPANTTDTASYPTLVSVLTAMEVSA